MPSPFYPQTFTQALVRSKCLRGVFDSLRGRKSSLLLLIPGRLSLSSAGPRGQVSLVSSLSGFTLWLPVAATPLHKAWPYSLLC